MTSGPTPRAFSNRARRFALASRSAYDSCWSGPTTARASGVLAELRDTLNFIWDVPTPSTGFAHAVRYRLITLLMVPGVGALMVLGIASSIITAAAGAYISQYFSLPVWFVHTGNLLLTV